MKRRWIVPLCLMLLAAGAPAEEYWLRYRFSANADREIVNTGSQYLNVNPPGIPAGWTAPQGALDPVGSVVTLGGDKFRLLFARSKKGGARDRLWVSRDGDWTKAAVYPSIVRETHYYKATPFGPVRFRMPTPDGEVDYHALCILMDYNPKQVSIVVQAACYYEDRIELEGKTHRVALIDANANGRYGDTGAQIRECDWLMIDLNDDGRLDAYGPDYKEVFTVGKYLKFGEKLYALTVAPDGACFTLGPTDCPTGRIHLKSQGTQFKAVIFGQNGRLALDGRNGEVTAPCGDYKLVQTEFMEPGANDQSRWQLTGNSMPDAKAPKLTVTRDKTAELTIGPPLTATLDLQKNGDQYVVSLKLSGQAGEEYTLRKGYSTPDTPPKLQVERQGSTEPPQTFSFEYG